MEKGKNLQKTSIISITISPNAPKWSSDEANDDGDGGGDVRYLLWNSGMVASWILYVDVLYRKKITLLATGSD